MKRFIDLSLAWIVAIFALVPLILLALVVGALPLPRSKRAYISRPARGDRPSP